MFKYYIYSHFLCFTQYYKNINSYYELIKSIGDFSIFPRALIKKYWVRNVILIPGLVCSA